MYILLRILTLFASSLLEIDCVLQCGEGPPKAKFGLMVQSFENIRLGGPSSESVGYLRVDDGGFTWRSTRDSKKPLSIKTENLAGFIWTRTTRGFQLSVRQLDGSRVSFQGFREREVESFRAVASKLGQVSTQLPLQSRDFGGL